MEIPASTTPFLWGGAAGAVAAMIVGFNWGGWMLTSTADARMKDGVDSAVVLALSPLCVKDFQKDANAAANLVSLKRISSSWEQSTFVEKGGWATRLGTTSPDSKLARACSELLAKT